MALSTIWQKAQTYTVVTVIAVLVWLYAEGENVKEEIVPVDVRLVAPPGMTDDLLIRPEAPVRVQVTIRASTEQISQLTRMTERGPLQLEVSPPGEGAPPQQVMVLSDRLATHPDLTALGINVEKTDPATLETHVERFVEVSVPVRFDAGPVRTAPGVALEPAEVTVRLPRSLAGRLEGIALPVHPESEQLSQLEENVPHELDLPPELPDWLAGRRVSVAPRTVSVTFTIRKQTDTLRRAGVPVLVVAPPSVLANYQVQLEQPFLREDIELAGPADVIERIRSNEAELYAELRLTADEIERGIASKAVSIRAPTGVRVTSPAPTVSFEIIPDRPPQG